MGVVVVRERLAWRRPARCDSNQCVEIAVEGGEVLIRNSEVPAVHLAFPRGEWHAFLRGLREGIHGNAGDHLAA